MIIVADASVLVAELLRRRGRELLSRPDLRVVVAEDHHKWDEEFSSGPVAIPTPGSSSSD